jgi:DNA polymerase III subunit gamma/tau
MSYTALYRKLRPKKFIDVIGQGFIVKTLINQITNARVSHAYLFCGTRGTGKTSVAKIFAKAINCQNNIEGEPCNECDVCVSIAENRNLNTIEIDAASNNGVDNIRDIREEVKYAPTSGKYKIYIIDEVHMLSTGAFNALLKTLEEPPKHVIFILATTDPQKIPATILSRCQRFDFRRIVANDMFEALKNHSKTEKIDIEEEALKYIAKISDGAMRDALSILDMSISYYFNKKVTYENILDLVGSVDSKVLDDMTDAFTNYDSKKAIEIIDDVVARGRDISQFINEILVHFRNLLVALNISSVSTSLDYSEENIASLKRKASEVGYEKLMLYINTISELSSKIKYAPNQKILLEVTCIKLTTIRGEENFSNLFSRIKKLESEIENGVVSSTEKKIVKVVASNSKIETKLEKSVPEDVTNLRKEWNDFVSGFNPVIRTVLKMSELGFIEDEGEIVLIVAKEHSGAMILNNKENFETIKVALVKRFNKEFVLKVTSKAEYDSHHVKIYGNEDEDIDAYKAFTEKINMNIIEE